MDQLLTSLTHISEPERSLVDALRRRHPQAMGQLYDKYAPAILGILCKRLADRKLAEDVLLRTFFRAWANIEVYDPVKERLFAWLLRLARETASESIQTGGEIREAANSVYVAKTPQVQETAPAGTSQPEALDLLCVKGYSLPQAAMALGLTPEELKKKLRSELSGFREKKKK
jgi:RNA polymerase sigma-70 factor (ECF subfamily)